MRRLSIDSSQVDLNELHYVAANAGSHYADAILRENGWSENPSLPDSDEIAAFWFEYLEAAERLEAEPFDNQIRASEIYATWFLRGWSERWAEAG